MLIQFSSILQLTMPALQKRLYSLHKINYSLNKLAENKRLTKGKYTKFFTLPIDEVENG